MEISEQIQVCKEHGLKPGDKINRVAPDCRYVARIGIVCDWAVYKGSKHWAFEDIAACGDKVSAAEGEKIFPEIAVLGLYYRP